MVVYAMTKSINRTKVSWERNGRMVVNIVVDDLVDSRRKLHEERVINKFEKSVEEELVNVLRVWRSRKN